MFRACAIKRAIVATNLPFVAVVPPYWFIVRGETGHEFAASSDSKISGFTRPHVIGFVADLFFPTQESGFKNIRIRCRIRQMRVDGSRVQKEKFADSKISGFVWTGPKFCVFCRTQTTAVKFSYFHLELNNDITYLSNF